MNESRSYRRIQDEASDQGAALDQGADACGLCGDDCRDQVFDLSNNPILGALFGALPSPEQIAEMRREATREQLLDMLSQANETANAVAETISIIVEIVEDELAGL